LGERKNFIAILEREYWTGLSDGKVNWNEINKDLKVFLESKIVCNTQKQLVIKKLNNIIKNKEIKKIEGLNLFSIYLWKMKIITWKAFRRRIIRK
jgi:CBS domain containing-hemolysin-like protein